MSGTGFGLIRKGKKCNIACEDFANLAGVKGHVKWCRVCERRMCIKWKYVRHRHAHQDTESFQTRLGRGTRVQTRRVHFPGRRCSVIPLASLSGGFHHFFTLHMRVEGSLTARLVQSPPTPSYLAQGGRGKANNKEARRGGENEGTALHLQLAVSSPT